MYWAHVLEKEYRNHTKKSKLPKKEIIKLKDIPCDICGQNKYWCLCDNSSTNNKFDLNSTILNKEIITKNASQKK